MQAKIIAITQPLVESSGCPLTPQEFIAYTARVSNPNNQMNTGTSEKLLRYCLAKKHWSVFEMVDIVIELETTRDIAHQIVRHRSFSFSEFSQRYADPTASLGFEYSEARLQDAKNRQSSIETDDEDLAKSWLAKQQQIAHESELAYKWAVSKGIAKELARKVLPEGLTTTRLYMKGSLRSWIHYLEVRIDPTTQKEHRRVAEEVECLLLEKFPFLEEYWYPPVLDEPYYEDDAQPKQSWYNRVLAWFGL